MSMFGTTSDNTEHFLMINKNNETLIDTVENIKHLDAYAPRFNHWNAVKGLTEEPEWCKGFNVTVRTKSGYEHKLIDDNVQSWLDVVAIRFDSVKEGWEL